MFLLLSISSAFNCQISTKVEVKSIRTKWFYFPRLATSRSQLIVPFGKCEINAQQSVVSCISPRALCSALWAVLNAALRATYGITCLTSPWRAWISLLLLMFILSAPSEQAPSPRLLNSPPPFRSSPGPCPAVHHRLNKKWAHPDKSSATAVGGAPGSKIWICVIGRSHHGLDILYLFVRSSLLSGHFAGPLGPSVWALNKRPSLLSLPIHRNSCDTPTCTLQYSVLCTEPQSTPPDKQVAGTCRLVKRGCRCKSVQNSLPGRVNAMVTEATCCVVPSGSRQTLIHSATAW